ADLAHDGADLVDLDEEPVVPVGAVQLDVAGGDAGGRGQVDDLARLVGRVEGVTADADRHEGRPQPGEGGGHPVAAPTKVVQVHGLGQDQVAVGVEPSHQL